MKRTRNDGPSRLPEPALRPTPPPRVPALVRGGIALAALGIAACASDEDGERGDGLSDAGEQGDAPSSTGGRAPMTPPMINGSGGLAGPMFNPGTGGEYIPPNPPPMIAPMPFPGAGGAAITPMPEPAAGGAPIAPMPPPMPAPGAGGAPIAPMPAPGAGGDPIAPMPPPMPAPEDGGPFEPER